MKRIAIVVALFAVAAGFADLKVGTTSIVHLNRYVCRTCRLVGRALRPLS